MATVLAFGCFDILHYGHLQYLRKAKALGDRLVVVVARDATALKVKGRAPVFDETARLEMVRSLRLVDEAVLGRAGGEKYGIIGELRPDFIALGYDQREDDSALRAWLDANGLKRTEVVRIRHVENEEIFKSSKALEKLKSALLKEL